MLPVSYCMLCSVLSHSAHKGSATHLNSSCESTCNTATDQGLGQHAQAASATFTLKAVTQQAHSWRAARDSSLTGTANSVGTLLWSLRRASAWGASWYPDQCRFIATRTNC